MPADEHNVVGAVCFFEDDDDRGAVVVICEVEACEIGCHALWVILTV